MQNKIIKEQKLLYKKEDTDIIIKGTKEAPITNSHNECAWCNETIKPDQWSENNFTLCIDCG